MRIKSVRFNIKLISISALLICAISIGVLYKLRYTYWLEFGGYFDCINTNHVNLFSKKYYDNSCKMSFIFERDFDDTLTYFGYTSFIYDSIKDSLSVIAVLRKDTNINKYSMKLQLISVKNQTFFDKGNPEIYVQINESEISNFLDNSQDSAIATKLFEVADSINWKPLANVSQKIKPDIVFKYNDFINSQNK